MKTLLTSLIILLISVVSPVFGEENKTVLSTKDALVACTTPDMSWVSFCNGLVQAYSDIVVINNVACIPDGTERRFLSELFADKATLYNQAQPATLTFSLILKNQYPCN